MRINYCHKNGKCSNNSHFKRITVCARHHLAGRFRVFGAKATVTPEMCLGLFDVRDLKPKHDFCDVFHSFDLSKRDSCVFALKV